MQIVFFGGKRKLNCAGDFSGFITRNKQNAFSFGYFPKNFKPSC